MLVCIAGRVGKEWLGNFFIHSVFECGHWISMCNVFPSWGQGPWKQMPMLHAGARAGMCWGRLQSSITGDIGEASHRRRHVSQVLNHEFFH